MNELALFAGAGGGILGGHLLGWRTVCAVEHDPYARDVLVARQNDGCLAPFAIWDDVRTFDGRPWCGRVDVVSGGFPCQDISAAGKGAGIDGERSGLWEHMARIIGEVRPWGAIVENSPMLTSRGLGRVLGDLAALGYDAEWCVLGAADAGAPHKRDRIWILAYAARNEQGREIELSKRERIRSGGESQFVPYAAEPRLERHGHGSAIAAVRQRQGFFGPVGSTNATWWESEPDVGRVAHGVAARVDRLRCLGNGQVPAVVRLAFNELAEERGMRIKQNTGFTVGPDGRGRPVT